MLSSTITNHILYKKNSEPNFKGIMLGNVKLPKIEEKINLFLAEKKDLKILEKVNDNLDLKKLEPNTVGNAFLSENDYLQWKLIIDDVIDDVANDVPAIFAVLKDKICGLMSFITKPDHIYLNNIATFPIATNKKIPLVGQSLIRQLTEMMKEDKIPYIKLYPLQDGRGNPKKFYEKLGFTSIGKSGDMALFEKDCNSLCKKTDEILTYEKESNPKSYDLSKFINTSY